MITAESLKDILSKGETLRVEFAKDKRFIPIEADVPKTYYFLGRGDGEGGGSLRK